MASNVAYGKSALHQRLFTPPALADSRGVNFSELYEFNEFLAARKRYQGAFAVYVLASRSLVVAPPAHFAYEPQPLRSAGETTNERGGTLVLPPLHFNA